MMKDPKYRRISTLAACAALTFVPVLLLACGRAGVAQPVSEAESAVRRKAPPEWTVQRVAIADFTPGPVPGTLAGSFSADVLATAPMGVVVETLDGVRLVKLVVGKGEKATVYGRLEAEQRGELWMVDAKVERAPWLQADRSGPQLVPVDSLPSYAVVGSPEAAKLRSDLAAREAAAEQAERERTSRRLAAERAAREARDAEEAATERALAERAAAKAEAERQEAARRAEVAARERRDSLLAWLAPFRGKHGAYGTAGNDSARLRWLRTAQVDEATLSVVGTGRDYTRLPAMDFRYVGRIVVRDDEVALHMKYSDLGGEVQFTARREDGTLRTNRDDGPYLAAAGVAEHERFMAFEQAIAAVSEQPLERGTARVVTRAEKAATLQALRPIRSRFDVMWRNNRRDRDILFDGDLGNEVQATQGAVVNARLGEAQRIRGIAFVWGDHQYYGADKFVMTNCNLLVNGKFKIALPEAPQGSVSLVSWPESVSLLEFEVDCLGGFFLCEVIVFE